MFEFDRSNVQPGEGGCQLPKRVEYFCLDSRDLKLFLG